MTRSVLLGPPPATLAILLDDPAERDFPDPARILGGLSPDKALAVAPGLPYSVAQIVAHMHASVRFNLGLIGAADPLAYRPPLPDWPPVSEADWPALADAFLAALDQVSEIARTAALDRVLYPAAGDEPAWTVGYKLAASVAKHNAYHLGQIVVIRRLLGAWDDRPAGRSP